MSASEVTKYLMFLVLNTVIATCGAILLAFGAILKVDENKILSSYADVSIGGFAIGMGVLVFIIAVFGCCALFKKKSCMLISYSVILIVLFTIQIVLGAIALGKVNNSKCEMDAEMEKAVRELFSKQDDASIKLVHSVQRTFHCCGVQGPNWWRQLQKSYPSSCCVDQSEPCNRPYENGCVINYNKAIEKSINVIGGVAIGFAVVEIIGAILAWYIQLSVKKSEYI